ncbi:putative oxidoreductase [Xylaria telfairii]|nr:putative oxidoreductase [Xylaria telfairii]
MHCYLIAAAVVGLLSWLALFLTTPSPSCRCQPWEPCWPSDEEWDLFNASINGNLARLRPLGYVCHDPTFHQSSCDELLHHARDSGWRASRPEALQDWVWEGGWVADEPCLIGGPREMPCQQGRVPHYSANVRSALHVQKTVIFAKKHNLRLVIKNTGHDSSGRSSAPNSLQIYTHLLKGIQYHADFMTPGAPTSSGPAVTIGAGVMHWELYEKGTQEGYIAIGGECPTVGAAGGFLLGGGVCSILSQTHGLAVDNVLQLEVVLANGSLVVANEIDNSDLFWALRGGGGGTFGVVTQATFRVFPNYPAVVSTMSLSASIPSKAFWDNGVAGLLTVLQMFRHENVSGQFLMSPPSKTSFEASLTLYFLGVTNISAVEPLVQNRLSFLDGSGLSYNLSSEYLPKVSFVTRMKPDIYPENYGILQTSVLISNELFSSPREPARITEALSRFPMKPNDILFTSSIGRRGNINSTSMHPAWHTAAHLITFVRSVEPTAAGKRNALEELHNVQMPILYSLDPNLHVSYVNLADPGQDEFQNVYWGANYQRLANIKRDIDQDELFISRLGVGSEEWDENGICRKVGSGIFRGWKAPGYLRQRWL